MTSRKSTKRALVSSALAILMCVAMLIGTTFAWFTDTVSTGVNKIQAGNLDIEVEYTLDGEEWAELDEASDLFGDGLFEPGYTRVVAFRISNKGNLALKYNMSMNLISETKGVNKAGEEFALSDYLKVKTSPIQEANQIGATMVAIAFDRDSSKAIGWNPETDFKNTKVMTSDQVLTAGQQVYFIMQVYMPETVGNEANAISKDKTPSRSISSCRCICRRLSAMKPTPSVRMRHRPLTSVSALWLRRPQLKKTVSIISTIRMRATLGMV